MRNSIHKSVLYGCTALILSLSLVLTLRTQRTFHRAMFAQYEARLRNIVTHLAHETDVDDLRKCIRAASSSPRRDQLQALVNRMVDEFELEYLYIIIPERDGQSAIISVVSSTSEAERAAGDHEDWPILYDVTEWYTEEEMKGYREAWQNPGGVTCFENTSDYGLCYTACKPLFASDGELVALACADYSVDTVMQGIRSYSIYNMIVIVLISTAFGLLLWLWLWRSVTQPIRRLQESVADFAERNHGRRDLDELTIHVPEIRADNEVKALADAVVRMAGDMRDYVMNLLETKHKNDEMKAQVEIADAANKAKGRFLAQMSHEIRTPINAVLGMNEMILNEAKDDRILDYASNIDFAGRQLLALINSILDFSKIEDGKMEIVPAEYSLAAVINNLVNGANVRAKMKSLTLNVEVDETLPSKLYGDDVRVTQVIQNILTNAVKYTEEGGVTFTVKNGGRDGDGVFLDVSVQDTGIGIRAEDMDKLFESFERLELDRNRRIEGTGLGMSIVTNLLKMMGSKLKVDSLYGVGSTFSFRLRQRVVDDTPIGNYAEHLAAFTQRQRRDLEMHAPEAKVLVVDDNAMNLKVAKNLLRMSGITPDLARSGTEAIDMIRDNFYDIVLMDHMMPGMDGIETLTYLREEGMVWPGMNVLALTANAVTGAREEYLDAGFADYLSKPIDSKELEEKLARFLPGEKVTWRRKSKSAAPKNALKETPKAAPKETPGDTPKAAPQEAPKETPKEEPKAAAAEEILEFGPAAAEVLEFGPEAADEVLEFGPDGGDDGVLEFGPEDGGAAAEADSADSLIERLSAAGLQTGTGLQYCSGDADFYRELLGDFAAEFAEKHGELAGFYEAEDWKGYRVVVHALKSVSKTIGAPELSEQARSLEEAAASEDAAYLKKHHPVCMELYRETATMITNALSGANAVEEAHNG